MAEVENFDSMTVSSIMVRKRAPVTMFGLFAFVQAKKSITNSFPAL
jgi:hypothetical protein